MEMRGQHRKTFAERNIPSVFHGTVRFEKHRVYSCRLFSRFILFDILMS